MPLDLGLFAVVPSQSRATRWAGRPMELKAIRRMLRGWRRRATSEVNVLWADFGQGKSHTLLYVQNETAQLGGQSIVHYVQLPPLTTGSPFVALYRQIMQTFPLDVLAARVFEQYKTNPMSLFDEPNPTKRAIAQLLWLAATKATGSEIARRWLRAEDVYAAELRSLQIGHRPLNVPSSPTKAQDAQNTLVMLIETMIGPPSNVQGQFVLLIDEFQRVGELPPKKRAEVCNSLHLIFNMHPEGFRLLLAFAGGLPEIVDSVLTADLRHRIHQRFQLLPLSHSDGVSYLRELLATAEGSTDADGLAQDGVIDLLVASAGEPGEDLSPRRINITCDLVIASVLDDREDAERDTDAPIGLDEVQRAVELLAGELGRELVATS